MVRVANPSDLHAALDRTSGSVTDFLEQLVGEGIVAHAWHHEIIGASASNELLVEEGQPLLHRAATLRGCISGCSYVYAESVIVTSRLPAGFSHRLESTSDPIGRILDEVGIAVSREDLVHPDGPMVSRPWNVNATVGDYLLARSYRIDSEQTPVMIIAEWFLSTLTPFLPLA
jgi:chorismate-pyruvate lyase